IHRLQPSASVGLAHHYRGFEPVEGFLPINRMIAKFRGRRFNDVFPRAVTDGKIRFLQMRESIPEARGTQDFFGLNYYTVEQVSIQLTRPSEIFQAGGFADDADLSPTGWIANKPDGFWDALQWAHGYGKPIYVTENGIEDSEDVIRPRYLASHLQQLWRAVNFNWRVKGYFHWTLVDNFEWEWGWTQRFGLWALDSRTQERTKRPSADFFAGVCKENALSSDLVRRFAPEVQNQLFPPRGPAELVERKK
ncbi:MAG: glycoside hydrolase family 1 protein, partial [Anaerolineales bacterium]|nr:glycoside hydrolase family 1 protein [Anaerolineales bacterium]